MDNNKRLNNSLYKIFFNKQVMFYNKDFMDFLHNNSYVTNSMDEKYMSYFQNMRFPELIVYPRNLSEYTKLVESCFVHDVIYCMFNKCKNFTIDINTQNMVILIDTCYIKQAKL